MFHKRDGQILKEGSLTKRAIGKSILTGPLNFKERWVVLTEKFLSYSEVADEVKSNFTLLCLDQNCCAAKLLLHFVY